MGHCITAIIGKTETIKEIADDWVYAKEIELTQGYSMVFLTAALFDDIIELYGEPGEAVYREIYPELTYFTEAIAEILQRYSFHTRLAYIETDYCGGVGTQAGLLYENGRMIIEPQSGEGTINTLAKELGVKCMAGNDEFDSLNLGRYRHME